MHPSVHKVSLGTWTFDECFVHHYEYSLRRVLCSSFGWTNWVFDSSQKQKKVKNRCLLSISDWWICFGPLDLELQFFWKKLWAQERKGWLSVFHHTWWSMFEKDDSNDLAFLIRLKRRGTCRLDLNYGYWEVAFYFVNGINLFI